MDLAQLWVELTKGMAHFTAGNAVMIGAGCLLIALAIVKQYEPVLLLPIGFGCVLANIPLTGMAEGQGLFAVLYRAGIETELFPLLIFVGVGAMIDFSPLLSLPQMALLGAAGQFGIFGTLILATLLGFPLNEAASIGVIGAIDGPTSIYVASKLAPHLLAPIAVAAYSYMSLIPIIQPPIMKLLTTKEERRIRMEYAPRPVSRRALVIFPIAISIVAGLLVPEALPLVSMLMLGNLLRESGVVDRLRKSAENEIINVATLFLGFTIGSTMAASTFLNLADAGGDGARAAGLCAGYGGRPPLWQADVRAERAQDQPAHRRGRHQRLSDGRAAGGAGGAGRGLRELYPDARHGGEHGRADRERARRGRAAGAGGGAGGVEPRREATRMDCDRIDARSMPISSRTDGHADQASLPRSVYPPGCFRCPGQIASPEPIARTRRQVPTVLQPVLPPEEQGRARTHQHGEHQDEREGPRPLPQRQLHVHPVEAGDHGR